MASVIEVRRKVAELQRMSLEEIAEVVVDLETKLAEQVDSYNNLLADWITSTPSGSS